MWSSAAIQVLTEYLEQISGGRFVAFLSDVHRQKRQAYQFRLLQQGKGWPKGLRDDFAIKHLLCWRKDKALALGGFDESIKLRRAR